MCSVFTKLNGLFWIYMGRNAMPAERGERGKLSSRARVSVEG